ncbi:hypothetical protein DUNSADRAFT_11309, partial [Dunaliella salina]
GCPVRPATPCLSTSHKSAYFRHPSSQHRSHHPLHVAVYSKASRKDVLSTVSRHTASPLSSSQPSSLAQARWQLKSQPATNTGPLSSENEASDAPSQPEQQPQPASASGEHQPVKQQGPVSPLPATSTASPGAETAFTPGLEGDSRRMLFNRISKTYDELNNRLSLGQHWVWKRMAVKWSNARRGQKVLDVCCGSGDIGLLLADV